MGFKPTLAYVTETYGGEWEERDMTPPAVIADPGAAPADPAFAEVIARALRRPTTSDRFAQRLADEGADPIEAMVRQVQVLFAECGSLEEARDRLLELFPKMDAKGFAGVMQRALTAGDLAGRYEAKS
jgi:phage gp29-like protein